MALDPNDPNSIEKYRDQTRNGAYKGYTSASQGILTEKSGKWEQKLYPDVETSITPSGNRTVERVETTIHPRDRLDPNRDSSEDEGRVRGDDEYRTPLDKLLGGGESRRGRER